MNFLNEKISVMINISNVAYINLKFTFDFQVIEAFINDTTVSRSGEAADQDTITLIWSFAVAIFAIGGMIGGLLAGIMADRFGRSVGVFLPKIKAKKL